MHMYAPYSRLKFGLATTAIHTRVQRLVTEHMQVPFSVTQGRYLLATGRCTLVQYVPIVLE